MAAPCSWPISYASCAMPAWDGEQQGLAEEMAVELLWNWTGRDLGLCEAVVRPCRADCYTEAPTFWGRGPYARGHYGPVLVGGEWLNIGCQACRGDRCTCDGSDALVLPGPVVEVSEILIDGDALPSSAYRVDNFEVLVRLDGEPWPRCQSMGLGIEEPDTWQITYMKGHRVPTGGQVAAGVLAVEMHKAICKDSTCQLPTRVQTVTRQGVTIALLDSFDDVTRGRTGLWLVDSWLMSVTQTPRRSRVYSVDVPRRTQRTPTS